MKALSGTCQQCGAPITFQAESIGTRAPCRHCGKTTELLLAAPPDEPAVPRRVIAWTLATILILLLGLVGSLVALKLAEHRAAQHPHNAHNAPAQAPAP